MKKIFSLVLAVILTGISALAQPVPGTVNAKQAGAWTNACTQSGTWTVQPGNTANTTPWLMTISQGGNAATVSVGGALKVDGSGATQPISGTVAVSSITTSVTPGTAAANLGKLEDSPHGSGDVGVLSLHVANEALTTLAGDGDNIGAATDTKGRNLIAGQVDNDAVYAGFPVGIGALAKSSAQTSVADNDMVRLTATLDGKLITEPYSLSQLTVTGNATNISTATNTTLISAVASNRIYVTTVTFTNDNANPNTVQLTDGSGGTILQVFRLLPNSTLTVNYPKPLRFSSATAVNLNTGSATNVYASAVGFTSPN